MFRDQIIENRIKSKGLKVNEFLWEMDLIIDRVLLSKIVEENYTKNDPSKWWRPRCKTETMIRMYFLSLWFNLSDIKAEEEIYDRSSFAKFMKINLEFDQIPDSTTLWLFRNYLNDNNLQEKLMFSINWILQEKWIILQEWKLIDATIIKAPSSTKNKDQTRDSKMSSTQKGWNYFFWCKVWTATDPKWNVTKVIVTTAKTHDSQHYDALTQEWDKRTLWDSAYIWKNIQQVAKNKDIDHYHMLKRKAWQKLLSFTSRLWNALLAMPRKIVEFPYWVIKNLRWYRKVKYKWLEKTRCQWCMLCWLCNIYRNRKTLLSYL